VRDVLAAHPVTKPDCLRAAGYIHPLALHQDPNARFWLLRPDPYCGPVAMIEEGSIGFHPKMPPAPRWVYHVCVETDEHCVCVLTGPDGVPKASYLEEHFKEADAIVPYVMARFEDVEERVSRIGRRYR
jgi:hypothetical protein